MTKSANTIPKSPVSDGPISLRKSKTSNCNTGGIDLKSGVVYVNEETTENGPTSNVMINTNSSSEVEVEQTELSPVGFSDD